MAVDQILAFADRVSTAQAAPPVPVEQELNLVVFRLGGEQYAIPIAAVREVIRVSEITRVPHAPPHIRGIMNLRGRILPVVEVRTRLGLDPLDPGHEARVVVVELRGRTLGLLVDAVGQVTRLTEAAIQSPPEEIRTAGADAVTGVARRGDQLLLLLALDRLLHYEA